MTVAPAVPRSSRPALDASTGERFARQSKQRYDFVIVGGCITRDGRSFFGGNFFHDEVGRDPETYVRLLGVDRDTAKMYLEFMEALRPARHRPHRVRSCLRTSEATKQGP